MKKIVLAGLLLTSGASGVAAPIAVRPGVWSGTVGNSQVTACFMQQPSNGTVVGSYYYSRHLQPISLEKFDGGPLLREDSGGLWEMSQADALAMTGVWRRGATVLPVTLTRVAGSEEQDACTSDAFHAPLEARPAQVVVGPAQQLAARRFRAISMAGVQLVELMDAAPAAQEISRQLRGELLGLAQVAGFKSALRQSLARYGRYRLDQVRAEPLEWTERWFVLDLSRESLDTGAAGSESGSRIWDMRTGKELDPWRWIGGKLARQEQLAYPVVERVGTLPPKLSRAVTAMVKERECVAGYGSPAQASLKAGSVGLEVRLGSALNPSCMTAVLLTYQQLAPFLTAEGKKAVSGM